MLVGSNPGDTLRFDIIPGDTLIFPLECVDGVCWDLIYDYGVGSEPSPDVRGSYGHFIFEYADGKQGKYDFTVCDSIGKTTTMFEPAIYNGLVDTYGVSIGDTVVYCGWRLSRKFRPRVDQYTYIIDSIDYQWAR